MKIWKTFSGIISILVFGFVVFQSCAAKMVDDYQGKGGTAGVAGMLVAIVLLICGALSISTRSSTKGAGDLSIVILYVIAAIVGYTKHGFYKDLIVWATWCLICAVVVFVLDIVQTVNRYTQKNQINNQNNMNQVPYNRNQNLPNFPPGIQGNQGNQGNLVNPQNNVFPNQNSSSNLQSGVLSNQYTTQNVQSSVSSIELIKKYKELLDMGAITQEEFDKKKQELLK